MAARAFVDTNILVYMFDRDEPEKRQIATEALRSWKGQVVLSTQVLLEFYAVTTRKLSRPLPERDAQEACRRFSALPVVATDARLVLGAIDLSRSSGVNLWDALIVVAAKESDCEALLTEDLQHRQAFGSVRVVNPFLAAADEIHERI